jgi:hypothetical protein
VSSSSSSSYLPGDTGGSEGLNSNEKPFALRPDNTRPIPFEARRP